MSLDIQGEGVSAAVAVIPAKAGIQRLNGIACGDARKAKSGFRAAGGLLFFACAKKSNQKKAHPGAAENPCASRPGRARAELAARKKTRPAQTPARETSRPRLRCSAAATGPDVNSNNGYRKAGYSLRRVG